ncbi:GNAT family N-acetyltransferase [Rhizobium sp. RAF56]|jgi:RimJ/RimL family protein N-acetyltransferase|uniref:GNAT family N-acetyltransferase n=1 Tax=Rhizobium sp. RAF56 TaxID=3233062 RepID=UPI003F9DB5A4
MGDANDRDQKPVRLLEPDDVEAFKAIRLEALNAEPAAFASTAADWESMTDNDWRRFLIDNAVFVAFRAGKPVGIMGLMRQRASKAAHRGTLIMVYLRASERAAGLADALLAAVVAHARAAGIRQLELDASADNPAAIRFYARHGFVEIGRIPAGLLYEGREIDEIMMARRIAHPEAET